MTKIARLLERLHVTRRFAESSEGAACAEIAQPHRQAQMTADDADRMHASEVGRIRQNPASLIAPRA